MADRGERRTTRSTKLAARVAGLVVVVAIGSLVSLTPVDAGLAHPTLVGQGTSGTLGEAISDNVILSGGSNPTGTITFTASPYVCSPGDWPFTSVVTVNGNGEYTSEPFVPSGTGTYYWIASYSGDTNNAPAATSCIDPSQRSTVGKATPTITTSATPAADIPGTIRDTATMVGVSGGRLPGGQINFSVFGPDDATCAGPPVFTNAESLSAPPWGTVTSAPFSPSAPGVYRWVASYGGDLQYEPVTAPCNAPNETSVVNDPPTRITTSATPEVTLGSPISDTAAVTAVNGPAPTGSVSFTLFAFLPGEIPTCTGPPVFTSANRPLTGGTPPTASSEPFIPQNAVRYRWVASYSGDANYPPQTAPCDAPDETSVVNKATATITTSATPTAVQGQPISDAATVVGVPNGPRPTGEVGFNLYGPQNPSCSGAAIFTSRADLSTTSPPTAASPPFTPTEPGTYRWVAGYSGDQNYESTPWSGCDDPAEVSVVTLAQSRIGVFRPSTGFWFVQNGPTVHWGAAGDVAVAADYDGNGPDDVAVFRPSIGVWLVHDGPMVQFGAPGDIPVPADYDGDRDDDLAVFRPSTGHWFVRDGPAMQFGTQNDIPVPADYDGDGDDDIAVFRPSIGAWLFGSGGGTQFGTDGDIPVPADYDGDGADSVAVYRPSVGVWLVQGGPTVAWGTSGDIPVPADYDGDGDDDIAVYRPSIGVWLVQGGPTVAWGTSGDDPLPLPAAVRETYFG